MKWETVDSKNDNDITATTDEAQVRERLESWTKAVRDKDLDALRQRIRHSLLL